MCLFFLLSNNLFVIMAEKRTSHIAIGTVSGCSSGRVTKKRGKGHRLSSQAKYIVNSVREFFEKEKAKQKATLRDWVVKCTAAACGIGVTTVIRLHKEYGDSGGILSSLKKRYDETRVQLVLNEVDVEGICKEVHEFYQRKEYPTLSSLMEKFKGNNSFKRHHTTLWKILREMGFRYKKHENKKYIYEQPRVIQQRHDYLRCLHRNRNPAENRPVVYLDETWVNARHGRDTMWVDADGEGGWKYPSGKGGRLIVLHAGTPSNGTGGTILGGGWVASTTSSRYWLGLQHYTYNVVWVLRVLH